MENATEALKMAFAVLVFVMAMSLAFMLVTEARSTADVVFLAKDEQEYVTGITAIEQTSEQYRIVGLDTIIPTIYRCAQENYGVTIIDDNEIVALYDLQVENTISKISSTWGTGQANEAKFKELCEGNPDPNDRSNTDTQVGIKTYINKAVETNKIQYDTNEFRNLFKNLYKIENPDSTSCPWTSSTYNIQKRIKADMTGEPVYFGEGTNLEYNGAKFGTSQGFMDAYGGETFKEYYYTVKAKNNLTDEEETSKLQIIYVKE